MPARAAVPGATCSGIAAALAKRGKRMIAYLPCEIRGNTALHAGFGWNSADGTDQRRFQERWSEAIRYWSLRYGELISGWWFDGCYDWNCFHHDLLDYPLYRQAVQAGNPGALLTFNDGCYCIGHTRPFRDGFDYFAGEAVLLDPATGRPFLGPFTNAPVCPEEECVNAGTGVTPHLLVSTDAFWGHLNSAAAVLGDGPSLFRDPALLRPGRFDRQIQVGLPGREERLDILRLHSRNKPMGEDVDLNRLAAETCSFSGASLEALLNEAAILAAERNAERIGQQDIDRAFYRTVAGEDAPRSVEPEEKLAIAAHEAGHAVALKALTPESRLKRVSILAASRGMAGYNLSIPKERTVLTQKEMEAQIGVLLAGRAAEVLLGGEKALTSGAAGDLRSAAELMGSMVLDLGMGGEPAVASRAVAAACGGGNSQEQAVCRQKLDEIYERVTGLLTRRMDQLTAITQALLEKEVLDGSEVEALMGEET